MPSTCEGIGLGWTGNYPNCTYSAGELNTGSYTPQFTGTTSSLNFGQELEGSSMEDDWQKYFDAYDPTRETMLTRSASTDVNQLGEAWGLQSQQLGEQYQEQLGGLFAQAGTGTMDLMSSWGGGGQTMTGRKGRQRKRIGSEASRQAGAYGMGLRQARDTGQLGLQQATTDIYQGLEADIYGERDKWKREQRSNLNTLLGMDIWNDEDNGNNDDDGSTPSVSEGHCPPGYYLATVGSGQSGCQPISGSGSGDIGGAPEFTDMDSAAQCASKGGYWNGSTCDFDL